MSGILAPRNTEAPMMQSLILSAILRLAERMKRSKKMKRYLVPVFCSSLLLARRIMTTASAQGAKGGAQAHIDKAKAAAYRTGSDLTNLYETVCAPAISDKGPVIPNPSAGGQASPSFANRKVPPKSEWMA